MFGLFKSRNEKVVKKTSGHEEKVTEETHVSDFAKAVATSFSEEGRWENTTRGRWEDSKSDLVLLVTAKANRDKGGLFERMTLVARVEGMKWEEEGDPIYVADEVEEQIFRARREREREAKEKFMKTV